MSDGSYRYLRYLDDDVYCVISPHIISAGNIKIVWSGNSAVFNDLDDEFYEEYKDQYKWLDVTLVGVHNPTYMGYRDSYIKLRVDNFNFCFQYTENTPFEDYIIIAIDSFVKQTSSLPVFSFIEDGNDRCVAVEKDRCRIMLYSTDDGAGGRMSNNSIDLSKYLCEDIDFEVGALPVVDYPSAFTTLFFDSCNYDQEQDEYTNTKVVMNFTIWGTHYRCEFDFNGSNPKYNDLVITLD